MHNITSKHRRKLCVRGAPAMLSIYSTCTLREKQENYLTAKQRSGRIRSGPYFKIPRFLLQHIKFTSDIAHADSDSCKCCCYNAFNVFQLLSRGQGEAKEVLEFAAASWQNWIGVLLQMPRYNVRRVLQHINSLPRLPFQSKSGDFLDTGEQGKSKIRMFGEEGLQLCFVLCGGTTRNFIVRHWNLLLQCCMMGRRSLCSNCYGFPTPCWACWGAQWGQKTSNKLRWQDLMELSLVRGIGRWDRVFWVFFKEKARFNDSSKKRTLTTTVTTIATTTTTTITTTIAVTTKSEKRGEELTPTTTEGGPTASKSRKLKSNAKDKEMAKAGVEGGKLMDTAQEMYSSGNLALLKEVLGKRAIAKEPGVSQGQLVLKLCEWPTERDDGKQPQHGALGQGDTPEVEQLAGEMGFPGQRFRKIPNLYGGGINDGPIIIELTDCCATKAVGGDGNYSSGQGNFPQMNKRVSETVGFLKFVSERNFSTLYGHKYGSQTNLKLLKRRNGGQIVLKLNDGCAKQQTAGCDGERPPKQGDFSEVKKCAGEMGIFPTVVPACSIFNEINECYVKFYFGDEFVRRSFGFGFWPEA